MKNGKRIENYSRALALAIAAEKKAAAESWKNTAFNNAADRMEKHLAKLGGLDVTDAENPAESAKNALIL